MGVELHELTSYRKSNSTEFFAWCLRDWCMVRHSPCVDCVRGCVVVGVGAARVRISDGELIGR